jgi:SAM-dependent methyltransferase
VSLCKFWKNGPRDVLDAGSGNGYFSWLAYKSGARVVAVNIDKAQVEKAREFFLEYKKADPTQLRFEHCNLYDLSMEVRTFDEIICYETIEHVRRDSEVVKEFFRILRPGGVLHLCAPNRLHPRNQAEVLDLNETGGHVRAGETWGLVVNEALASALPCLVSDACGCAEDLAGERFSFPLGNVGALAQKLEKLHLERPNKISQKLPSFDETVSTITPAYFESR